MNDESMEQQVLQSLKHENIIVFKRILFSISHIFIEMEKITGGTLEAFITTRFSQKKKAIRKLSSDEDKITCDISPLIRLKEPVIEEEMASKIMKDICKGLSQIHKQNYIHRDLKPENILIAEQGDGEFVAKIADFGLTAEVPSNVSNGKDKINSVTGTILYMAPEQATGQRYGKRVDMWALGVIVYEMLTGKHPFFKDSETS